MMIFHVLGSTLLKSYLWINQLFGVACLPVGLVLRSERLGFIELDVHISIAPTNLIITPCSMAMVLRPNEHRNTKPESNEIMLKSRGMFVFDEVVDKFFISSI